MKYGVLHLREFELGSKAGVLPPRETLIEADLAGLVIGSTTHKVIHLTDRPVLIVR